MNLDIAINVFVNEKECFSAEKTVKYYRENLDYFKRYLARVYNKEVTEIDINDIKHTDYNLYVKELRSRKKLSGKGKGDKKLSNATIKHYTDPVKFFFKYLYQEELIDNNIAKKMRGVSVDKKVLIPLFKDEIQEIDKCFNLKTATGLRNYIMIHLMLDCGMRISETYNLEIKDVYFDKNFIHIRDSKHNKDRIVPLPSKLKSHIYKYVYLYRKHCDHNYVLQNRYGDKNSYEGSKNIVRRIRNKTEIERLKNHLFRHTFATSYILCGGDVASLAVLLGHGDITVTNGYLHLANTYKLMGKDNLYKVDKVYFKRMMNL
ncbi:MAG: site-specific integrase [Vallitalea sp.]|jgi:integrase/recombinase XerC/integrase/recombinase XerD|nr:site-specific integrase [Vallitalea sp.]